MCGLWRQRILRPGLKRGRTGRNGGRGSVAEALVDIVEARGRNTEHEETCPPAALTVMELGVYVRRV